jgi:hypothetical protein
MTLLNAYLLPTARQEAPVAPETACGTLFPFFRFVLIINHLVEERTKETNRRRLD